MLPDTVMFPHCDLHAVLNGPPLHIRLAYRSRAPLVNVNTLSVVTSEAVIDFFAPHNPVGQRLVNLPTFDPATGLISGGATGVYLFQVRMPYGDYLVGRLQVHDRVDDWWFGNDSITTALDPMYAHAQPSIYAKFNDDDDGGAEIIGDITGHGWVTLTSSDESVFVVDADGRLRGVNVTGSTPASLRGEFMDNVMQLPVTVHDYKTLRKELDPIQVADLEGATNRHNLVFLSEGFRDTDADRQLFDETVARVAGDLFDKPRHQPYPMLEGNFNVFKAFAVSNEYLVTPSYRITDNADGSGFPIPRDFAYGGPDAYPMDDLVAIVGLPPHGENRAWTDLKALWSTQSLAGFDPTKVNQALIEAWKVHQGLGILNARDTYFGLQVGRRWGDRGSGRGVVQPAADSPGPALSAFVARLYEFYWAKRDYRVITPDPRRHPPELHVDGVANPKMSIFDFIYSLAYRYPPYPQIGPIWVPTDDTFVRSRGMVVFLINDGVEGGTSVDNNTLTMATLGTGTNLGSVYLNPADKGERRRHPEHSSVTPNQDHVVDLVAHELGHSFNLGDEYEESGGQPGDAAATYEYPFDNVTRLGAIHLAGAPPGGRPIDPHLIKWFELPRMRLSAGLVAASTVVAGNLTVTIDPKEIGLWVTAKATGATASLRNARIAANGRQLPLSHDAGELLTGLAIGAIDETAGTIVVSGAVPAPPPTFGIGSLLFVPKTDASGTPLTVVDPLVYGYVQHSNLPLNVDPDITRPNRKVDSPVDITGLKKPCDSYRLVGVYEGAAYYAATYYRPAGGCKMRGQDDDDAEGEFCYVCKWLIVNRVDPSLHSVLDGLLYPRPRRCCG